METRSYNAIPSVWNVECTIPLVDQMEVWNMSDSSLFNVGIGFGDGTGIGRVYTSSVMIPENIYLNYSS